MEKEGEPATQDRRYAGTRPFDTQMQMDTDSERRKRTNVCINKTTNKKLQSTIGHGPVIAEQTGEQMPMPVRYETEKGAGRRCCGKHTGVPRSSASLHETLHRKELWSKGKENRERNVRNRFDSTSSSLRARSLLLPRPPPFIGQEGAVRY